MLVWKISSVEAANLFSKRATSSQPGLTIPTLNGRQAALMSLMRAGPFDDVRPKLL